MSDERRSIQTLQEMADDCHVSMSVVGRNVLTGGPVDRLPPRLWEQLRLRLQYLYRQATGEQFAVLVVEGDDQPASAVAKAGELSRSESQSGRNAKGESDG